MGEVGDAFDGVDGLGLDEVDCCVLVCDGLAVRELCSELVGIPAVFVLVELVNVGELGIGLCTGPEVEAGTSEQTKPRRMIRFDLPSNGCATSEHIWTGTRVEDPAESVFQSPTQVAGAPASSVVVTKGSVLPLMTVASYITRLVSQLPLPSRDTNIFWNKCGRSTRGGRRCVKSDFIMSCRLAQIGRFNESIAMGNVWSWAGIAAGHETKTQKPSPKERHAAYEHNT